jgi:hypothetical protein
MRTIVEYLEKAAAFDQLAAGAANDLIRNSYIELAKAYRDLAENRRMHLTELAEAIANREKGPLASDGGAGNNGGQAEPEPTAL